MKKIKSKIALVLALACFTSSAFGEESGLFFGAWLWRTRRKTKHQKHQTA